MGSNFQTSGVYHLKKMAKMALLAGLTLTLTLLGSILPTDGVMFAPINGRQRGGFGKRGDDLELAKRDCYDTCLTDCAGWKDASLSFCVSKCREHTLLGSPGPFQAAFHCVDTVNSLYFRR